jgi:tetratricopeptide (TPR) repeat protein
MLAIKNRVYGSAIFSLALAVFIAGCAPPGPRALLKGKKLLEEGDYAAAVAKLKVATSLLATNAPAWNYLGVAYQRAGQSADAVVAYQRALTLDRDLVEAHYNLGCLWLEQNKLDPAKAEFTAYTLRRNNAPEGWLKLGLAQLRARELVAAEKSFGTVLSLNPNNPEALNGLGLAQIQRGHPREAAQDFSAAARAHPDYAPALLNLATVAQEYLHDNKLALQNYHAYLALTPRPPKADAVDDLVRGLEQPVTAETRPATSQNPPPQTAMTAGAPVPPQSKTQTTNVVRVAASPKAQTSFRAFSNPPPRLPAPAGVVSARPGRVLKTAPVAQTSTPQPSGEPGVWHSLNPLNWFQSGPEQPRVTPLPSDNNQRVNSTPPPAANPVAPLSNPPAPVVSKPARVVAEVAPSFPRYAHLSPRKPKAGDRPAAQKAFAQGRGFEDEQRFVPAMQSYRDAAGLDPAWFEAQYNFGVLAYRLQNYRQALSAYEMALAIQPDSVDARYNFALALRAAGYPLDAADGLEKILAANPDEVRAHLALGNLCARQLQEPSRARAHYLKVLELDPRNPQAAEIHFWLASNPP